MISKIILELRPEAILLDQVIDKAKEISVKYKCEVEFEFNNKIYIINENYKIGDIVNFKCRIVDIDIDGTGKILKCEDNGIFIIETNGNKLLISKHDILGKVKNEN